MPAQVDNPSPAAEPAGRSYPYASSPDIIRANQKDVYFQSVLFEQLSSILRSLYGARFLHNYSAEARTAADTLYLALTTLIGNRTLGEEYCDIVQVEGDEAAGQQLPGLGRRAGYIATSILLPYALGKVLPSIRRWLRAILERRVQHALTKQQQDQANKPRSSLSPKQKQLHPGYTVAVQAYLLRHLDTLTSQAPVYAVSLATFYFTGAYYHLGKRAWDLRYIFTRQLSPADQRAGYEVLGVLLVLQLAVQAYLHVHETVAAPPHASAVAAAASDDDAAAAPSASLDPNMYSANNALLFHADGARPPAHAAAAKLAALTHTPVPAGPAVDLEDRDRMRWLAGRQARKCTLCLEPMKDPAATTCGHLFCWACICDWCREKPECPLCRQDCAVQHILPLRG